MRAGNITSFEHAEDDVNPEHQHLVLYHTGEPVQKLRCLLETWK